MENTINNQVTNEQATDISPVTAMMMNESGYNAPVNDDSDYYREATPETANGPCSYDNKTTLSRDDYAYSRGRNREYYPDPTYHQAKQGRYSYDSGYAPREKSTEKAVPYYIPRHSRRHETIGLIMRICELAGFELAERVVLRDKETGEVLR